MNKKEIEKMKGEDIMLSQVKKNDYHMYNKADIEHLGLTMYDFSGERADWDKYASKSRLEREFKIKLTEKQLNNPDAFSRGQNGYYPIWIIDSLISDKE